MPEIGEETVQITCHLGAIKAAAGHYNVDFGTVVRTTATKLGIEVYRQKYEVNIIADVFRKMVHSQAEQGIKQPHVS